MLAKDDDLRVKAEAEQRALNKKFADEFTELKILEAYDKNDI